MLHIYFLHIKNSYQATKNEFTATYTNSQKFAAKNFPKRTSTLHTLTLWK